MIKVAILGYGSVGSGVFQIIKENKELITNKAGQEIDIKYVLDLREFPGDPCENVLVHDYNIILNVYWSIYRLFCSFFHIMILF